ncbi:hypothetical protein F2Q69_00009319 [Brassica cretica]|uniref:Uncharacterized protein n=1 Tax=Brassica cretica TaxID=69181 RepID=A0A8S9NUC7_BRACR|nr:hypothetical protein F2Q69_00009319 [Brassica cretica]
MHVPGFIRATRRNPILIPSSIKSAMSPPLLEEHFYSELVFEVHDYDDKLKLGEWG